MKIKLYICLMFCSTFQFGYTQESLDRLKEKVEKAVKELSVDKPNHMDPLALNAAVVWSEDKTHLAIVMKAELLDGWHTYAYVPETQPYINSELRLKLPNGIMSLKNWVMPSSTPYEKGVFIYSGTLVFVQYCKVDNYNNEDMISCGLYYQTCDIHKCFPPVTKIKNLNLTKQ